MPITGTISLPGDKSISHRSLMFAALTDGECVVHNISTGEDVESTRNCLEKCGIKSKKDGNTVIITGGTFKTPEKPLNCGNSGTTVRLLLGLLAGQGISATYIGDNSLSKRPMGRVIKPLESMGVNIKSIDGKIPLKQTVPTSITNIDYYLPIASAQVKSCVLLAALGANVSSVVRENIKTRDHTEIMLKELGASIKGEMEIEIQPLSNSLSTFEMTVPGDPSSAAFFATAAASSPNSHLTIKNVLANPSRIGFFNMLEKMGGGVEWENMRRECGELVGDVQIWYEPLNGINITAENVPAVIDELPILAVLAAQADGPTIIEGAEELRVKECDRIHAVCHNLKAMGVKVIEKRDGFIIDTPNILQSTSIKTYGDHRIAMAFTIAGLNAGNYNVLDNAECINISFPEFNSVLQDIIN